MEQQHLASQITFQFLAKCFYVSYKFAKKIKLKVHFYAKLTIWSMSVHLVGQMSRSKVLNVVSKWHFFILALFFCLNLSFTLCFCQLCGINARFSTGQLSWKRPRLTAESSECWVACLLKFTTWVHSSCHSKNNSGFWNAPNPSV